MNIWKRRLSALCIIASALVLGPLAAQALGPSGSSGLPTAAPAPAKPALAAPASEAPAPGYPEAPPGPAGPAEAADSVQTIQPEAAPQPAPPAGQDTPAPDGLAAEHKSAAPPGGSAEQDELSRQIEAWTDNLSKEAGFADWSGAAWSIYPLGPGTHSWVVIVKNGGAEIGYMVVASTGEGGYRLMEYGLGQAPLFSTNTLYQTLVQRGLIPDTLSSDSFMTDGPYSVKRLYIPPMQAVWLLDNGQEALYLDAKTGQELPDIGQWLASALNHPDSVQSAPSGASGLHHVAESAALTAFDPFIKPSWLKGTPLKLPSFEEWKSALTAPEARITYSGKWYGGQALYPLPVTGYHLWENSAAYIRLEHDGPRYVPYEDAAASGSFYQGS